MADRYFAEDQQLVKQMLKRFKRIDEQTKHLDELFIDNSTGQTWEKYEFELENQLDYATGLRRFPYPGTDKIIEIALTSSEADEINGAAGLLLEQELYAGQEFRHKLLSRLEETINTIDAARLTIIYDRAKLYDKSNKREILGKSYREILEDAEHFSAMKKKADELREKIISNGNQEPQ